MTGEQISIRVGWLIDGSGRPARKDMLLSCVNGEIRDIVPFQKGAAAHPAEVIDLSRYTILPPLVDSHLHLFMSGTVDKEVRQAQLVAAYEELCGVIAYHLDELLRYGVLAVRDGGDRGDFAGRFVAEQGSRYGLTVKTSGCALHRQGRYGSLIGLAVGVGQSPVEVLRKSGHTADCIKVVNSGLNSLCHYGKETRPQFTPGELASLSALARDQGKKVMVHANGEVPVREAIETGCNSIEHGFFMGEDNIKRLADSGVFWVPTLYTMQAYGDNLSRIAAVVDGDVIAATLDHQIAQLAKARELGVKVALGTDSGSLGVFHGRSMAAEMRLFCAAGFSIEEVIRCATASGAELLGLEHSGCIEQGGRASFLVAGGTPETVVDTLGSLEDIWVDGVPLQQR